MIQPASKGPFVADGRYIVNTDGRYITEFDDPGNSVSEDEMNARYFAHAANMLQGCVEAMAEAYADIGSVLTDKKMHAALAKLKAALDAARGEK